VYCFSTFATYILCGIALFYYSHPFIASVIANTVMFCRVIFSFFPSPIFRRPWANFHETLPHVAVFPEIVSFPIGCLYVPPKKFEERKTPIFADLWTQDRHFEPRHSLMRGKSGNLKQ